MEKEGCDLLVLPLYIPLEIICMFLIVTILQVKFNCGTLLSYMTKQDALVISSASYIEVDYLPLVLHSLEYCA